jgi:Fe-S-cluster containining protein
MVYCFRCGQCCKGTPLAIIPKTEAIDFSEANLEKIAEEQGYDALAKYIDDNYLKFEGDCPWLSFSLSGEACCNVHEHRSQDCRNYPGYDGPCKIGAHFMQKLGVES